MKFNFKRVTAVIASLAMLGSTLGLAAAANYPEPFVTGGTANGAVVIGASAASSDWAAAVDLGQQLDNLVTSSSSGGTSTTVDGESVALFTGSTNINFNDTLNTVKSVLTDSDLPTILADGSFSGNADASITQTITMGSTPRYSYERQPTDSDDPQRVIKMGTTDATKTYSMKVVFDKTLNMSHPDSQGETMTLFGQKLTVGAGTSTTDLVLFKSSETLSLSVGGSNPSPSTEVTIDGKTFTVELTGASDTSATIRVTDSSGASDEKEINEASSKKIQGLEVGVSIADESTATSSLSAKITVGTEKLTFKHNNKVKVGTSATSIDGTKIALTTNPQALTQIVINVSADDSSSDAIIAGGSFVDPVFGTFKLDFAEDATTRETLSVQSSSDTKISLSMTDHNNNVQDNLVWYYNRSADARLADSEGDRIRIKEMALTNVSEYLVVGNEDEGYLLEVVTVDNSTNGYASDEVTFKDVFSGTTKSATLTGNGTGEVTIGGKVYGVTYAANPSADSSTYTVRLNDNAGSTTTQMIAFPTIETSKGAKVMFYEPITSLNLSNWDGLGQAHNLTGLLIPDGSGYTTTTFAHGVGAAAPTNHTWVIGGTVIGINATTAASKTIASGKLNFVVNGTGKSVVSIYLKDVAGAIIKRPALVVFEEEDDSNAYQALILKMDNDDKIGVSGVEFTWSNQTLSNAFLQLETDDDVYSLMDYWGTTVSVDESETDKYVATIAYPDEQVNALVYLSSASAVVTPGTPGGAGGKILVVKDTEVDSVKDRNLVVVGGSCINQVAAEILTGSKAALCGADFSAQTNVGAGQYIIKVAASPYNAEKIAMLVAGYEAADTVNAVNKVKTDKPSTEVGESIYPQATA